MLEVYRQGISRNGFGFSASARGTRRPEAKMEWNARMSSKRILITNDDGINAPGIKALEQSLAAVVM
jgi:hypothetical protein